MERVNIFYNHGDTGNREGRGSLGGGSGDQRGAGTFSVLNQKIEISFEINPLKYSYVVVWKSP